MKLLTTKELAERLGVSTRHLMRWRAANIGPKFFRSGEGKKPKIFYKLSEVKAWESKTKFVRR